MKELKLFLFYFHGKVRVIRAADGEKALNELQERYPYDRTMLRGTMTELTTGPEKLLGGGYREPWTGIVFDQKELEVEADAIKEYNETTVELLKSMFRSSPDVILDMMDEKDVEAWLESKHKT
ncbi:hypothetical protein [Nitrospira sp. BLG_2]|uniref:hypothetical protein n=1 Tax=Nitrospira sp. BLG_2 TaxID=3397507 RepID=UPI003B9DAED1